MAFFQEEKMSVMEWPANSADLNLSEKVWCTLARQVCYNGKQYLTATEL